MDSGFLLSESELRKLIQTMQEHTGKIVEKDWSHIYTAKFKDGSIIETGDLEHLLSLENYGQKQITEIRLLYNLESDDHSIEVVFQDGHKNQKNWTSMSYHVVGQTRDWAFLAASDIEERLKKLKKVSFIRLLSNKATLLGIMLVFMIIIIILSVFYNPPGSAVEKLAEEYEQGGITDAVQAIIYLERAKVDLSANILFIGGMASMPVILITFSIATNTISSI